MQIVSETTHEDGSAWIAAVKVRGVIYRASFVASKLTVGLGPYKHRPRRPQWAEGSVRTWAEKQVAALPAAWMDLHRTMYASDTTDEPTSAMPCAS